MEVRRRDGGQERINPNQSPKRETVTMLEGGWFADDAQARAETFRWIAFYNHRCRHRGRECSDPNPRVAH